MMEQILPIKRNDNLTINKDNKDANDWLSDYKEKYKRKKPLSASNAYSLVKREPNLTINHDSPFGNIKSNYKNDYPKKEKQNTKLIKQLDYLKIEPQLNDPDWVSKYKEDYKKKEIIKCSPIKQKDNEIIKKNEIKLNNSNIDFLSDFFNNNEKDIKPCDNAAPKYNVNNNKNKTNIKNKNNINNQSTYKNDFNNDTNNYVQVNAVPIRKIDNIKLDPLAKNEWITKYQEDYEKGKNNTNGKNIYPTKIIKHEENLKINPNIHFGNENSVYRKDFTPKEINLIFCPIKFLPTPPRYLSDNGKNHLNYQANDNKWA